MSAPSPDAAKVYVLALILPWAAVLPTLGFGFTREDWLFLWAALDPQTSPAGATGTFARPVAFTLWKMATAVAGDHPLGIHAAMVVVASVFILALVRLLQEFDVRSTTAVVVATALLGSHAALVELRLWASASNGLLAGALGLWGATLLLVPRWWLLGVPMLVLGVGARADAAFFLALPAVMAWDTMVGRRRRVLVAGLALVAVALAFVAWNRWHTLQLAHAGELARRLILPWGGPLPAGLATGVGVVALAGLLAVLWRTRDRAYRTSWLLVLLPLVGAALVPWAPAGRYLLVPVVGLSIAAGRWVSRQHKVIPALPLVVWIALNLGTNWVGDTASELWRRSSAEVALYRAVQDVAPEGDDVVLVDAPPLGWRGQAADAENVVSVAMRRPMTVHLVDSASRDDPRVVLAWMNGSWRLVR